MATFVRGVTFLAGGIVTAGGLETMVSAATISGIDRYDIDTGYSMATVSATKPASPYANEMWQDSTEYTLRRYDSTLVDFETCRPEYLQVVATQAFAAGEVVRASDGVGWSGGRLAISRANETWIGSELGVTSSAIGLGAYGHIVVFGVARPLVVAPVVPGDALSVSSTPGYLEASSTGKDLYGGIRVFAKALTGLASGTGRIVAWLLR